MPHERIPVRQVPTVRTAGVRDMVREITDVREKLQNISDALEATYTVDDINEINLDFDHIPMRVTKSTDQAIPTAALTVVTFETEVFDTYEYWNVTTPSRFTFLIGGVYLLRAWIEWELTTATTGLNMIIRLNGGAALPFSNSLTLTQSPGAQFTQELTTFYDFAAGDYIELQVHHAAGTDLDILQAKVEIMRISPSSLPRAGLRGFAK